LINKKKRKKDGTITLEEMCQVVAGMEKSKKVLFFFTGTITLEEMCQEVAGMEQSNKILYYTPFLALYY